MSGLQEKGIHSFDDMYQKHCILCKSYPYVNIFKVNVSLLKAGWLAEVN